MRCLIVGCGSIGRRRGRILSEMGHEVAGYDTDPAALRNWPHRQARVFALGSRRARPDVVFVCSPPGGHMAGAMLALDLRAAGLFVEKPLSTVSYERQSMALMDDYAYVAMGACNMRFAYQHAPHVPGARLNLESSRPLSAWRPGAEAAYRANGLILESAIHELDVAVSRHGPIFDITAWGDADSVEIRVDHHAGATSLLSVSWAEDAPDRRCLWYDGGPLQIPDTSDTMYRAEMQHFLDCVKAGRETCNPLANAAHVLGWAIKAQEQIRAGVPA